MSNILEHLKQTQKKEWTLEDKANYLLYSTKRQVELYSQYTRMHNKAERQMLEAATRPIISKFGETLNIIGLAAGTSEKESIILKAALLAGKRPNYFAVDKSFEMLKASGINVPLRAEAYYLLVDLFSTNLLELGEAVGAPNLIAFLGYTAFNFGRTKALRYLQQNMATGDSAIITVGLLPKDLDRLIADYFTPEIQGWFMGTFVQAGFAENDLDYRVMFDKTRKHVKLGAVASNVPQHVKAYGIEAGDYLVLSTSIKLPLEGRGGYLPLIGKYLHIDNVFTEPTGMTAVIQASAKA